MNTRDSRYKQRFPSCRFSAGVAPTFKILYSKAKQPFSFGAADFSGYDPATGAVTIHQIALKGNHAVRQPEFHTGRRRFQRHSVPDFATYAFSNAGWGLGSDFFNPNLHPILAFTFGTPNADVPVMTVPSYLF